MAGAETSAAGWVQVRLSSLLQTKRWRPQEKTCGSVTLTHIQYVSLDSDGSFSDFALAEPVAINVFPVCPSYMKTWMTVPGRIGSLPHLDTAAQENEKSSLPPEWHWDEECCAYKQQLDWSSGLATTFWVKIHLSIYIHQINTYTSCVFLSEEVWPLL